MVKCSACCQQVAMLQGLCVCVNRNMKIANSSHIKRFFHYFFVCCCCCFFFAKEWRRKYSILRKQFKAISSYIGKLLKEDGYLFSDGSKREVEMAGYWPSSFFAFYGTRLRLSL